MKKELSEFLNERIGEIFEKYNREILDLGGKNLIVLHTKIPLVNFHRLTIGHFPLKYKNPKKIIG